MAKKIEETPKFDVLNVDGTRYRTNFIRKYNERKPYKPANPDQVLAMIPGTIVKIMVKEGQKVTEGKCLYVLEAMKMKNRFNAEVSGIISKIHVSEGEIIPRQFLVMEFGDVPEIKVEKTRRTRSKTK